MSFRYSSPTFGGGVRVFQPIPNNPAEGGSGYFRRSVDGGRTVFSPSTRVVNYTAMPGVPDVEPGGNPTIAPRDMAFMPDGRLMPKSWFPQGTFFAGATLGATTDDLQTTLGTFLMAGILGGALVGSVFGAVLSNEKNAGRAVNGAIGGGLGALAGAIVAMIVGRGAVLTKKL